MVYKTFQCRAMVLSVVACMLHRQQTVGVVFSVIMNWLLQISIILHNTILQLIGLLLLYSFYELMRTNCSTTMLVCELLLREFEPRIKLYVCMPPLKC